MSKTHETVIRRRVLLPDGRYLIYYTFAPAEARDCLSPAVAENPLLRAKPAEEK